MDGDRLIYGAENGLSRRGALTATVVGSAFALSVQPVSAQTITTPADGLTVGVVKVKTKDGKEMDAYRAMPATGTALGTVLVVQEIFGVHAHIADLCRRLAKAGYYAISPELYFRQGDPKTYTEIPKLVSELVSKVPDEQVMGDLDSTVAFAKGEGKADTAKLAVTGFCWGGRIVWMYTAHNPGVKAAWPGMARWCAMPRRSSPRTRSISPRTSRAQCSASTAVPTPASPTSRPTRCGRRSRQAAR